MYVAITRAKERLYLTRSKSRYLYGKREPSMRSRFLKELSSVVELPLSEPRRSFLDDDFGGGYGSSSYGKSNYSSYGGNSYGGYGNRGHGYDKSIESDEDNYVSFGNQSYSFSRKNVTAASQKTT